MTPSDLRFNISTTDRQIVKLANQFYKTNRYGGRAKKGEYLAHITYQAQWVAICRLTLIEDFYLLRNLCVSQAFRHQGLGQTLLKQVINWSQHDLYTFPLAHLETWYATNGFTLINEKADEIDLPATLRQYYSRYQTKFPDLKVARFPSTLPQ